MTELRVTVLEPDTSGWHLIATEFLPVGSDLSLPVGDREILIEEIHARTERTRELQ